VNKCFDRYIVCGEDYTNIRETIVETIIKKDDTQLTVILQVLAHGEVYSIQHYVIKFVSELRQVSGFLWFPPSIKLNVMI
jgi:hypothetical protein